MRSNISPKARDNSISPRWVCRAIAVVRTRVKPRIFPPTISTQPTSEIALPNPSKIAEMMEKRASFITVMIAWVLVAPRERAVSFRNLSTPLKAEIVSPISTGVIRIA
ncbi:MAG: hypothetical protein DDT40_01650 [candidate division WS2 bacterium]|nr:hypothetical protein [Candidatus Psychracetigena formicireducens]